MCSGFLWLCDPFPIITASCPRGNMTTDLKLPGPRSGYPKSGLWCLLNFGRRKIFETPRWRFHSTIPKITKFQYIEFRIQWNEWYYLWIYCEILRCFRFLPKCFFAKRIPDIRKMIIGYINLLINSSGCFFVSDCFLILKVNLRIRSILKRLQILRKYLWISTQFYIFQSAVLEVGIFQKFLFIFKLC